jgi:TatD DNase family protein
MGLIDTHTHLDSFAASGALPGILDRARAAGLEGMIAIGTAPDDWGVHRGIAGDHPGLVHATVGLHPCVVDAGWAAAVAQLEAFWRRGHVEFSAVVPHDRTKLDVAPSPVALGECGLDRFHLPKDAAEAATVFAWQRDAFAAQLDLARRLGCPLVVHSRGAFRECVEMITASGVDWTRVVFHCFSEGPAEIAELGRLGGRGSFTGILTYKNAESVRAAAREQGLGRLMIETDAPYLAPVPHRGKPNEPAYVKYIAAYAAELFGVSYDELAAITTANARAFFGL